MILFFMLLAVFPVGFWFFIRRFDTEVDGWKNRLLLTAGLTLVAAGCASPHITGRCVGTGEGFNYSLALADAITQMRSGELVPLTGQTEYAFNGRVHPLRTAPYLFYQARLLDLATLQQLTFWQLQNLSLVASVMGAMFACYLGLRHGVGASWRVSALLASGYVLSPGLLASAYSFDLYMTVHAAPFLPLALGACLRQLKAPSMANDIVLAAALGAAWAAHPPVALCFTAVAGLLRLVVLIQTFSWRQFAQVCLAGLAWAGFSAFGFASALSLGDSTKLDSGHIESVPEFVAKIMDSLSTATPACLLPIVSGTRTLGDLQLGYALWVMLVLSIIGMMRLMRSQAPDRSRVVPVLAVLLSGAVLLLCLTLPIPVLTQWLWNQVPERALLMINIWPMQRFYLSITVLVVFSAALVAGVIELRTARLKRVLTVLVPVAGVWTLYQAAVLLSVGFSHKLGEEADRRYLSSNIDLTITSYAFFAPPPTFTHGVMDLNLESRILNGSKTEITSSYAAALASSPEVGRGDLVYLQTSADGNHVFKSGVTLQPGKRHLLAFDFDLPIQTQGVVILKGEKFFRIYNLPSAGKSAGFGLAESNRKAIGVWTVADKPENIEILLISKDAALAGRTRAGAVRLMDIPVASLPVRVKSLVPLRLEVEAPAGAAYLETFRCHIPGYEAVVNGRVLTPEVSPDWMLMVRIPAGKSTVEIRYKGPGYLRGALWVTAVCWLGFALWCTGRMFPRIRKLVTTFAWKAARAAMPYVFNRWVAAVTLAAGCIALWFVWPRDNRAEFERASGPVLLEFELPLDRFGKTEAFMSTGKAGTGTIYFLTYEDETHVRVGVDIWGIGLMKSEPIEVDYFKPVRLLVDAPVLNTSESSGLSNDSVVAPWAPDRLAISVNGRTAIDMRVAAPAPDAIGNVFVGGSAIGGSTAAPVLSAPLLKTVRAGIPMKACLLRDEKLTATLQRPAGTGGRTVPLWTFRHGASQAVIYLVAEDDAVCRFGWHTNDGFKLESGRFAINPKEKTAISVQVGFDPSVPSRLAVEAEIGSIPVFAELGAVLSDRPVDVVSGMNVPRLAGIEDMFPSAGLKWEISGVAKTLPISPPSLIVGFPVGARGQSEPLLTTGRTGAGDFAYVKYVDDKHVVIGVDHWGVGGAESDPIEIDYLALHRVDICFSSFFPGENDPSWGEVAMEERRKLLTTMSVKLDGKTVVEARIKAHPTAPGESTPGENRIGGSSCGLKFGGVIWRTIGLR